MANKIQFKRGLEANLPNLNEGEPGFTTNTGKLFIGSPLGNVEVAKKADVDSQLAQKATDLEQRGVNLLKYQNLKSGNDWTPALQKAIDDLKTVGGTIDIPNGVYDFYNTFVTYRNIKIKGIGKVKFNCWNITSGYAIHLKHPTVDSSPNTVVLENIELAGHSNTTAGGFTPPNYTTGLTAFRFEINHAILSGIVAKGFDKTTKFESDSYIISFDKCVFAKNNYGFHYDATGITNTGERINFTDCTLGNNNYGIYNNKGGLLFVNCSIDYSIVNHVQDNITENGGYSNSILRFVDCHIERTFGGQSSPAPAFINSGKMEIRGGQLWDYNDTVVFQNNAGCFTYLDGVLFVFAPKKYACTGTGKIVATNIRPLSDIEPTRLTSALSNIRNNGFELGNLNGWKLTDGTNASVDATKGANSTKSLKISRTGEFNGTSLESIRTLVPTGKQQGLLTFHSWNASGGAIFVHVNYFDFDGNNIQNSYVQIDSGETEFIFRKFKTDVPAGAFTFSIKISAGNACVTDAWFDEFYMDFY